ncbi:MAG TPA: hypothetical protein VI588_00935, partial [Candidatus Gracilibacteria bacterium]|nr:hypothetical protein [Candidatus Gracilibacteria bacterium]
SYHLKAPEPVALEAVRLTGDPELCSSRPFFVFICYLCILIILTLLLFWVNFMLLFLMECGSAKKAPLKGLFGCLIGGVYFP